jgi:hypothetical protein
MKGGPILVTAGVLLLAATLLAGNPLLAKSVKTPVDFYEVSCATSPGVSWEEGNSGHLRGATSWSLFYQEGNPDPIGMDSIVVNINENLVTGKQEVFGTFSLTYPLEDDGTFDGRWTAKFDPAVPSFLGRAVGHGTGDLTGKKMKLNLEAVFLPPDWILGILDDSRWTEPPCLFLTGVSHVTGFIHSPKGN